VSVKKKVPLLKEGHPLKELESPLLKPKLLKTSKLAFLAGVFEGEGSMGYWSNGPNRKRIECSVTMSDKDIVERFKTFFDCGYIIEKKQQEKHHKICWCWTLTGWKALQVLEQMLPYFGSRRSKKYYDMVKSFRLSIQNGSHVVREQTKRETSHISGEAASCGEDGSWRD